MRSETLKVSVFGFIIIFIIFSLGACLYSIKPIGEILDNYPGLNVPFAIFVIVIGFIISVIILHPLDKKWDTDL
jgi:uncharacterized protein YacL